MKKIEILGTGCKKCNELAEFAKRAADYLQIEYELEKVTDIQKIMEYGVMAMPALVVDGEVKSSGKVLTSKEIEKFLTNECCSDDEGCCSDKNVCEIKSDPNSGGCDCGGCC